MYRVSTYIGYKRMRTWRVESDHTLMCRLKSEKVTMCLASGTHSARTIPAMPSRIRHCQLGLDTEITYLRSAKDKNTRVMHTMEMGGPTASRVGRVRTDGGLSREGRNGF